MKGTAEGVLSALERQGWRGRIVSTRRLEDLRDEMDGRHRRGQFDEEFYRERLTRFAFNPPAELPNAASIILVAVPEPQVQVTFTWQGRPLPLLIAPTFLFYGEYRRRVGAALAEALAPEDYTMAPPALPLKALAARAGLAEYGKNNICYVPGMGSFFRLLGFYSNLSCNQDGWHEPRVMGACGNCTACQRGCPSGAIAPDRFLLHAERCIDLHKERPGPYPEWLDPAWHDCLVGCMHCQRACPQNKEFLNRVEPMGEFTEQETALLLSSAAPDSLPAETVEKLRRLDLLDDLNVLTRDLGIFARRAGG